MLSNLQQSNAKYITPLRTDNTFKVINLRVGPFPRHRRREATGSVKKDRPEQIGAHYMFVSTDAVMKINKKCCS